MAVAVAGFVGLLGTLVTQACSLKRAAAAARAPWGAIDGTGGGDPMLLGGRVAATPTRRLPAGLRASVEPGQW